MSNWLLTFKVPEISFSTSCGFRRSALKIVAGTEFVKDFTLSSLLCTARISSAPAFFSLEAIAKPIGLFAPVTNATFPLRSISILIFSI